MGAVAATQVASAGPVSTTERVMVAWVHATPVARRATALAVGTSPILGAMSPTSVPMSVGTSIAGALLALAAVVDLHERRLPNRVLAIACAAVVVPGMLAPALGRGVALGAVLAGGLMLVARLRGGVGMGDVKAAGVVGAATGALAAPLALVALAVAATSAAVVGLVRRRAVLPLGPALWLGWAVATAWASMGPSAR